MTLTFFQPEPPSRVAVKICGVRTRRNAADAVDAGADAIGINLWPRSRRFVELAAAGSWLGEFAGAAARVAVMVDPEIEDVARAAGAGVFDAVQLHGRETPEFCAAAEAFGLPVIKAHGLRSAAAFDQFMAAFSMRSILLDAHAPGTFGGTGMKVDWGLAARAVARAGGERRVILAGGLTPDNVAAAVRQVRPAAVDVAGGVESAPGVKDAGLVRAFVAAAAESSCERPDSHSQ